MLATGVVLFELTRREFVRQWGTIQEEIEKEIKRREACDGCGPQVAAGERPLGRPAPGTPALELRDVRKSFGKTEIIRGASLAVQPGERVAIIGPNGAGKSTLFNLISGRFRSTSGDILLNGRKIDGLEPYEINRLGLARSFQVSNLFTRLSVFENIRCAVLWSLGYRYAFWRFLADLRDANDRTDEVLEMIKLDRRRDVLAMNLTYAEQRALEIGITIAGGSRGDPARRADRRHEQERDRGASSA